MLMKGLFRMKSGLAKTSGARSAWENQSRCMTAESVKPPPNKKPREPLTVHSKDHVNISDISAMTIIKN